MDAQRDSDGPPCPRCGATFFSGKVGHVDALGCGRCGGLWLDNDGTTAVLRICDADAEKLAHLVDGKAAQKQGVSPLASASGGCPICKQPLKQATRSEATLDYCEQHGTFFDRGELARVLADTSRRTRPAAVAVYQGPSLEQIRTEVRHDLLHQEAPLMTALMDWMKGGHEWVNRWRT